MHKICNRCSEVKPLEDFHNNSQGLYKKSQRCKTCACKETAQYRNENYTKVYANKFNTSEEVIKTLLARQVCDICGANPPSNKRNPIDHCHTTGIVRGILCWECNKGLGNFKDSPELLKKAINYLATTN